MWNVINPNSLIVQLKLYISFIYFLAPTWRRSSRTNMEDISSTVFCGCHAICFHHHRNGCCCLLHKERIEIKPIITQHYPTRCIFHIQYVYMQVYVYTCMYIQCTCIYHYAFMYVDGCMDRYDKRLLIATLKQLMWLTL